MPRGNLQRSLRTREMRCGDLVVLRLEEAAMRVRHEWSWRDDQMRALVSRTANWSVHTAAPVALVAFVLILATLAEVGLFSGVIEAAGAGASGAVPVQGGARSVTLSEAVEIALKNSLSLAAVRLDLEDASLALDQARAENLVRPNPAALVQAENSFDIARRKVQMEEFNTRIAAEQDYYNVLKAADYADIAEKALALAERQLSVARSKFAAGAGTQSEVIGAVSKVAEARASLAKARGSYDLALLKFRQTLGLSLDDDVVPVREEFVFQEYLPDVEKDIEFALANRVEILQLMGAIRAAETQVEVSSNDYTPELALKRAKVAEDKAANGLEQLKYGIELEIRQAYLSLVDLSRQLEAQKENVAEAEENLRIARKLLAVSMATQDQVMAAELAVAQAQMNLRHTLYDYNIAKLGYDKVVARPLAQAGEGGSSK